MKDKDKRHQVLQLFANVVHFSEEEKERVHLTHLDIESVRNVELLVLLLLHCLDPKQTWAISRG
jgi:hypothetical protein